MMRITLALVLAVGLVVWGCIWVTNKAYEVDTRNAEKTCAAAGARPEYTYRTHYLCVTPDGRVLQP